MVNRIRKIHKRIKHDFKWKYYKVAHFTLKWKYKQGYSGKEKNSIFTCHSRTSTRGKIVSPKVFITTSNPALYLCLPFKPVTFSICIKHLLLLCKCKHFTDRVRKRLNKIWETKCFHDLLNCTVHTRTSRKTTKTKNKTKQKNKQL